MLVGLDKLDKFNQDRKPTSIEMVYYLFWEKGIDYNTFNKLPLPYIFSVLKAIVFVRQEEEKAIKRMRKR